MRYIPETVAFTGMGAATGGVDTEAALKQAEAAAQDQFLDALNAYEKARAAYDVVKKISDSNAGLTKAENVFAYNVCANQGASSVACVAAKGRASDLQRQRAIAISGLAKLKSERDSHHAAGRAAERRASKASKDLENFLAAQAQANKLTPLQALTLWNSKVCALEKAQNQKLDGSQIALITAELTDKLHTSGVNITSGLGLIAAISKMADMARDYQRNDGAMCLQVGSVPPANPGAAPVPPAEDDSELMMALVVGGGLIAAALLFTALR
jgi:adenosyl cobinamide kinase/adenosyl cobinamide phosphate guanylyltransferase